MARGNGRGGLECGMSFVKYTIFIINVIFFLLGGAMLGVGIYLMINMTIYEDTFEDKSILVGFPASSIGLGAFILIGSALGSFGAIRENTCFIKLYLLFIIFVMLIEMAIAGLLIAYATDDGLKNILDNHMKAPINECKGKNPQTEKDCKWLSVLQSRLDCCGYSSRGSNITVPTIEDCQILTANVPSKNKFCNRAILSLIDDYLVPVAISLGAVLFVELMLIVGTCLLLNRIRDDEKYA